MRRSLIALVLIAGMSIVSTAQTPPLTNDDVVKMVKAQLALGVIVTTIDSSELNFDLTPGGLISLKQSGVPDALIQLMQTKMRERKVGTGPDGVSRSAPEKSDVLATSKDREFILRNFKTMMVVASRAKYFGSDDLKGALGGNQDFQKLDVSMVDDRAVADTILDVDYTFAWDYPFTLKHQNTSILLVSGKGSGPFSGPAGAASVARELAKLLKPYRMPAPAAKGQKK